MCLCSSLPAFVIRVTSLCDGSDILAAWTYSPNLLSREKQDHWDFVRLSAWFLLSGAPAGWAPTHRFGGKLIIWHMGYSFSFLTKQQPQRSLSWMHLTSQNSSPTQQRTPQVIGVMQSQNNNSGNRGPRPLEQVTCYKVMLRRERKRLFHSVKRFMNSELCSVDVVWCLDTAVGIGLELWSRCLASPGLAGTMTNSVGLCCLLINRKTLPQRQQGDCQAAHFKIRVNSHFLSHKLICLHWWVWILFSCFLEGHWK